MPRNRDDRLARLRLPGWPFALHEDGEHWYWYRPGELLVRDDVVTRVRGELDRGGIGLEEDERRRRSGSAMRWFRVRGRRRVPEIVERFADEFDSDALVSPVHVFGAAPVSGFGPATSAEPAAGPRPTLTALGQCDPDLAVGVLDTGVCLRSPLTAEHRALALHPDPQADEDVIDVSPADGLLDDTDVHGSFIADLIREQAPGATVRVCRALLDGLADELEVAAGIAALAAARGVQVLNLSLYGYTHRNREPVVLREALDALPRSTAVVAAAGNDGEQRKTWPAAFQRVVGVGAVDAQRTPPPWTNQGPWVDACALGVDVVSSFVDFTEPGDGGRTFAGLASWSGTSFATPLVAARIIAKVRQEGGTAAAAADRLLAEHAGDAVPGLGVFVP